MLFDKPRADNGTGFFFSLSDNEDLRTLCLVKGLVPGDAFSVGMASVPHPSSYSFRLDLAGGRPWEWVAEKKGG